MSSGHYIIPVFIPDLACPFQCVFCNQKNISGRIKIPDANNVTEIVEKHLATIPAGSFTEIGFFGGNFTGVEKALQQELLAAAEKFITAGKVNGIRISTRPDYINEDILNFLKSLSVSTIELGAQSFDDEVLRLSGRGHNAETTVRSSLLIKQSGFSLGLQMMVGLPGDTLEKAISTAKKIAELGADNTRIYPALVIKDTVLEKLFSEKKYIALSLNEAISQVKEVYRILEDAGINILRVGLHPSEGLINKEILIAGPFHVSFRELVLTEIWREILNPLLQQEIHKNVIISVPPGQMNYAIGYNASNKKMLQQHFHNIKFVTDSLLIGRNYYADYSG
jgi:histone acetyltransferase (RNA polymerase elongator complex component)